MLNQNITSTYMIDPCLTDPCTNVYSDTKQSF